MSRSQKNGAGGTFTGTPGHLFLSRLILILVSLRFIAMSIFNYFVPFVPLLILRFYRKNPKCPDCELTHVQFGFNPRQREAGDRIVRFGLKNT